MIIFKKFQRQNLIQYTPKRTKLHHLKNYWEACPRTPLAMRMASPCEACREISQSEKNKFLAPCHFLGTCAYAIIWQFFSKF